jgi:hypothetical protein
MPRGGSGHWRTVSSPLYSTATTTAVQSQSYSNSRYALAAPLYLSPKGGEPTCRVHKRQPPWNCSQDTYPL